MDVRKNAYWPLRVASEEVTAIDVLALALLLMSVTEVAVMVIEVPEATEDGTKKLVMAPLPVDMGLKVPQVPAGEQLQVTPAVSWETLALTLTGWLR